VRRAAAAAVAVLALVACTERTHPLPVATTPPPSVTVSPTPSATRAARPVTIAFGGDVHFEGASRAALTGGLKAITPLLSAADVAMVNLETAVTDRGTKQPKDFNFRAPATAFAALRAAGVDVVTEANNHGEDYGEVGLRDSIAAARAARFPVVGVGLDADRAYAPWRVTVRGMRLAFFGATHVLDDSLRAAWTAGEDKPGLASAYEEARLLGAVRAARRTADTVVVYLHWGAERHGCPIPRQYDIARKLVAAGADVVVGSHAHVLLGAGMLGRALVSYGLGNFVFYARGGLGAQTGVLTLTVTGRHVDRYVWAPAVIVRGLPVPLSGTAAADARRRWIALRGCTNLAAQDTP
jgi:poly-gamma-glutamate synthesis protein (capsule biosynthesis protein)